MANGDELKSSAPARADALPVEIYEQLRAIARHRLAGESRGHTLQATALVHEAWLKLSNNRSIENLNRASFVIQAAEAMRRILVDHARGKNRIKRGGGEARRISGDVADLANLEDGQEILDLHEAVCRFEKEHPQAASVVKLRFYAGLSIPEAAASLGISESSVKRDWNFARVWLHRTLSK